MSTSIDMMVPTVEPDLARRLEALTGQDAACCAADLVEGAEEARRAPGFDQALARAKALSDEKRLLALALIKRRGEMCGCELQCALGLTHATVSHHMATLLDAHLVTSEKRGKWVHYALAPDASPYVP